jgi:hypothetical protein
VEQRPLAFPHLDPASHLHKKLKHAFLTWKKAESVSNSRIQNVTFAESEDALLPPGLPLNLLPKPAGSNKNGQAQEAAELLRHRGHRDHSL